MTTVAHRQATVAPPEPTEARSAGITRVLSRAPVNIGLALIGLLWLVPTLGLLLTSLMPASDITTEGWWNTVAEPSKATLENYRALFENQVMINSAHSTNYGERAVDTFYVTDLLGGKITSADRLRRIEDALLHAASDQFAVEAA